MSSFEIITCVPEAVEGYLQSSILGRAAASGTLHFQITALHDFGQGRHHQVDDAPYGGGSGMVLKPEPLVAAIEDARKRRPPGGPVRVILLCPSGQPFRQETAQRLAKAGEHLILVCGRYEGVDARVEAYVDERISLGDFVLTGGELAALTVVDTVARLLPGVLGNDASSLEESFQEGRLEYPQYTRPQSFRGEEVPEVLLSGDHARIATWRCEQGLERTRERRPDLLAAAEKTPPVRGISIQTLDESNRGE